MAKGDNKSLKNASKGINPNSHDSFEDILNRIKAALGANSDGELSNKFGIRRQTISQARKKGEVPAKWFFQVSEMTGCSIDWLRSGKSEPPGAPLPQANYRVSDTRNSYGADIEGEHLDIVRQLKDNPLAREICQDLLELETLNPEALKIIGARIKGLVEGIRLADGSPEPDPLQQAGHRKHIRKQTPDGTDRREGKNRNNKDL